MIKESMQFFLLYIHDLACCGPKACLPSVGLPERQELVPNSTHPTPSSSRVCLQAVQHLARCSLPGEYCMLLQGSVLLEAGKQPGLITGSDDSADF